MTKELFYTELAKYYDKIYDYIDYEKQAGFFVKIIRKYNNSGNEKILDVACGTGTHADLLHKQGFEVTGLDISEDMLTEARKKNPDIDFINGDMKELNLNEKFGIILCFFNSILYNVTREEMKKTLTNLYNHLDNGGILIFDTVDKSIGINAKREEFIYNSDNLKILFRPKWVYNEKENKIGIDIEFLINGKKLNNYHVIGSFSFEELKQIIEEVGFEVLMLNRSFEDIELFNQAKEAVFVCRK